MPTTPRPPRLPVAPACSLLLVLLAALALPADADELQAIVGEPLTGDITLAPGSDEVQLTDGQGQTHRVRLIDVDQMRLGKPVGSQDASLLLIDNDQGTGTHRINQTIKLRAGLHRITVPYWQAAGSHTLTINVSGPGINGQTEPNAAHFRFYKNPADDPSIPSAGIDEQGYRLPELSLDLADNTELMAAQVRYRLYESDASNPPGSLDALSAMTFKTAGTDANISTRVLPNDAQNVGLVFETFFIAKEDGEYDFILRSNDGSQLHFGQADRFSADNLSAAPDQGSWLIELAYGGQAHGRLKAIADDTVVFELPLIGELTHAISRTRALWVNQAGPESVSRDNEAQDLDTLYLRDKQDPKIIHTIAGQATALDDASLTFVYDGQERTIARQRVVGLVLRHASRTAPPPPGMHQAVHLLGGQVLPCRIAAIGERVQMEVLGGGSAAAPRSAVRTIRIINGRRLDLTTTPPTAEDAIPYFGLTIPHRLNETFNGEPIKLFDGKTYERGLAVHSKSRLYYKLDRPAERFRATFGLLDPGGQLGDVTARVLGDGQVLWQQENITADTKAVDVDVKLDGVKRLVLEVDFGQGQDVGDRAAWCNPVFIFAAQP